MFIQMLMKEKRAAQLYTLIIFLILALVFLAVTLFLQVSADRIYRSEAEINERKLVEIEKTAIANKIDRRVSDVLYVADSLRLNREVYSDNAEIEEAWIAFSNRYGIYDQIRYIDQNGDEKIRINYSADGAYAVSQEVLQNKADRYYFINTITLARNDVFISKLDLNVENGEIEQPVKPMLRLATPYFGPDGSRDGIVILNYAAEDMLGQIRSIAASGIGKTYLLNLDGYWLYNSADSALEWAFMYDNRMEESFAAVFPAEWETIQTGDDSGFFTTDNGVFTYTSIALEAEIAGNSNDPRMVGDSGAFYIVSFISAESDTGLLFTKSAVHLLGRVVMKYLSIYFLLTGVAFVLAAFIAVGRAQKKEIRYFSEYDAMTGVYNRRTGYGKLYALKKDKAKGECGIAICFVDINGLKDVNDRLGHDAGDELIKTIADAIKNAVRGNDFVARLGGDEFLIVFDSMAARAAEAVWGRIVQKLTQINDEEGRAYVISASHGIAVFRCGDALSVDEIINDADGKMYAEKRRIKKDLKVIRDRDIKDAD